MGDGARPLSAADRGHAVRPCRDAPRGRGGGRRRRAAGPGAAAAGQGRPCFRHGRRPLDTGCRARPDRRCRIAWPRRLSCHSGRRRARSLYRAWRKPPYSPVPPAFASSSGRDHKPMPKKELRRHDRSAIIVRTSLRAAIVGLALAHGRAARSSSRRPLRSRSPRNSWSSRAASRCSIRLIVGVIEHHKNVAAADQSQPDRGTSIEVAQTLHAEIAPRRSETADRGRRRSMRSAFTEQELKDMSPSTRRRSARR